MVQERLADSAVLLSAASFTISFSMINEVVQILAGLAAIISGVCASVYYVAEWLKNRKKQ